MAKIGVLALQGDFKEHIDMLKNCKVAAEEVRLPRDLQNIDGLIIPGGESTTIGKLMCQNKLDQEIIKKHNQGMAIYGTCAGAILLSKSISGSSQPRLNLLDISVVRNEYGRKIDSFETELDIDKIGKFKGIFIRAPVIGKTGKKIKILSRLRNNPVFIQQDNIIASTFHPELTDDNRIHNYFLEIVRRSL